MTTQDIVPVTIKYEIDPATGQAKVVTTPSVVEVTAGQTIWFQRVRDGREGTFRLTFVDKYFFDTGNPADSSVLQGDGYVRVNVIPSPTRCDCEWLDASGSTIATGGHDVKPVKELVKPVTG